MRRPIEGLAFCETILYDKLACKLDWISDARGWSLRGQEQIGSTARLGRSRRGSCHYAAWPNRCAAGAASPRHRSRTFARSRGGDPRDEKRRQAPWSQNQGPYRRRSNVSLVLDASLALSWYFDDEVRPAADDVLERVGE